MATEYGDLSHLLPAGWKALVTAWFQEDCPSFDYGGFVVGETPETATLYGKSKVPHIYVFADLRESSRECRSLMKCSYSSGASTASRGAAYE
jgi:hypothetical protein